MVFAKKAQESLRVANDCFANACYNSCVNRAYYAMFQISAAALFKAGVKPSAEKISHSWLQSEFSRVFMGRSKQFAPLKGLLNDVQEWRERADYTNTEINHKKARRILDKANFFVEHVTREVQK